jgi:hypothetical protein
MPAIASHYCRRREGERIYEGTGETRNGHEFDIIAKSSGTRLAGVEGGDWQHRNQRRHDFVGRDHVKRVGGAGSRNAAEKWEGGLPFRTSQVTINVTEQMLSAVKLAEGDVLVNQLAIAEATAGLLTIGKKSGTAAG